MRDPRKIALVSRAVKASKTKPTALVEPMNLRIAAERDAAAGVPVPVVVRQLLLETFHASAVKVDPHPDTWTAIIEVASKSWACVEVAVRHQLAAKQRVETARLPASMRAPWLRLVPRG